MKLFFLGFWFLLGIGFLFSADGGTLLNPDLKKIVHKYMQNKGVRMNFKKTTYLKLLKKTKKSAGEVLMSKGSFVLKVADSLNTQILFDGNHLWYIISPPDAKKQIEQINLNTAEQNKHLLSILFSSDLFFQNFRFISSRSKGRTWILDFEPVKSSDIKSFSVKVDGGLILKVWLEWKVSENKEEYTFSNIRFNQNISPARFQMANNKGRL